MAIARPHARQRTSLDFHGKQHLLATFPHISGIAKTKITDVLLYWQRSGSLGILMRQLDECTRLSGEPSGKQIRIDKYVSIGVCILSTSHLLTEILDIAELLLGAREHITAYPDVRNSVLA